MAALLPAACMRRAALRELMINATVAARARRTHQAALEAALVRPRGSAAPPAPAGGPPPPAAPVPPLMRPGLLGPLPQQARPARHAPLLACGPCAQRLPGAQTLTRLEPSAFGQQPADSPAHAQRGTGRSRLAVWRQVRGGSSSQHVPSAPFHHAPSRSSGGRHDPRRPQDRATRCMVFGKPLAELQHMWAQSQAPANALFAKSPRSRRLQRAPLPAARGAPFGAAPRASRRGAAPCPAGRNGCHAERNVDHDGPPFPPRASPTLQLIPRAPPAAHHSRGAARQRSSGAQPRRAAPAVR